jgi:hypothetical protein
MKRMKKVLLLVWLASRFASRAEADSCVAPTHDPRVSPDLIRLVPSGFPSGLSGVVAAGMEKWNNPSCNPGGRLFSYFQLDAGADRTINVVYVDGLYAQNEFSCGHFTGNEITIYSKSRNLQTGVIQNCGTPDRVAETVAHELGHLLGLTDQGLDGESCNGYIMSQVRRTANGQVVPRYVQGSECGEADTINQTWIEANPTPASDPSCDAYCWTSCQSGACPANPQWDAGNGSPILIDLDRNGFELTGLRQGVLFDLDADGNAEITAWTSRTQADGFVVLDRNYNGRIDDGAELFGNATPLAGGQAAPNGYVALQELDTPAQGGNGDGWIGPEDTIFPSLGIWIDSNQNGISEPWELYSFEGAGVLRIATHPARTSWVDRNGNQFRFVSKAWIRDPYGRRQKTLTADVFFRALYAP